MFKYVFAGRNGTLYAINELGDLLWFRHLGFADGTNQWASSTGVKIASGWGGYKRVFVSNRGVLYAIGTDGTLFWFQHLGHETGEATWANAGNGLSVGSGWASALRVVVADDGVLYLVHPNGDLDWYQHTGFDSGAATWLSPQRVGSGWNEFDAIEASSGGVLYCRKPTGELLWYKHLGYATGAASWANSVQIGSGWNVMGRFTASGAGVIYAVRSGGALDWYRNDGFDSGAATWRTVPGILQGFACLVALRASNGQYVCAEGGGGQAVVANRDAIGEAESLNLIYLDTNRVALQVNNGMYLCAEGGGGQALVANRTAIGAWETFALMDRGGGQVALQAYNGEYVCAEGGGGQVLIANRGAVGPWETFALSSAGADGNWALVAGSLKHVSVAADGTVWGTNSADNIYRWLGGGDWVQVPGSLKQVSVGSASQVWGVNTADNIYRWLGDGDWVQVPGSLKHVSVAADGTVWGVNSADNIYRWLGGGDWVQVPGSLKQVSVGSASQVWGVNTADNIYRWLGGGDWVQVPGSLKYVSVSSDGIVWGVNSANQIYRRSDNDWVLVPGTLKQIAVGSSTRVWGVTPADQIAAFPVATAVPIPSSPAWSAPGTTTPTPASGNATWDQDIKTWFADGIEFLTTNVKVRWVGEVTVQKGPKDVVYRGRMEFSKPLGFTVDNVSFTVGTDPTGFFSVYILKVKLPISATEFLDACVRPQLESALWSPFEQMARPALVKAGEVYFILAKGAARDSELGDILYGLNLYAKLPMSSIEPLTTIDRLVSGLGLQNKSEVLHVALCRQPLKTLLIELLSQIEVPLGDGSLVLSEVSLIGSANLKTSTMALGVNCRFRLTVGNETLILRGSITVDSKSVVTLWGALDAADGKWVQPFGIPGLVIGGFGVQMSLLPGPVVAGFGARGEVHFGDKLLGGSFAILRDPTQPVQLIPAEIADGDAAPPAKSDPVTVPAEVTLFDSPEGINLPALLAAFAPEDVASNPLVKNILNLQLTDLNFYRANGPLTIAGQFYNRGWSFRARLNLWGYRALVEGKKSFTGIYLHGTFDPIRIQAGGKDFFAFTSTDGKTGPFIYIDAMLSKQGLSMSGQLTLFGGPSVGADVSIDDRGFEFKVTTEMGGLYGGASLRFDGTSIRIAQTVTFPYSLVANGVTVTLAVSAVLSIEASLARFRQTVAFSFDALGLRREMKLLETTVPFPGLSDVAAAFQQFYESDVKGIFGLLTWVPHTDVALIPHLDGPMIPHADAPIIPHGDVSFIPHADVSPISHGDVSFIPHVDIAQSGHADAAAILHADIAASAHIDSVGYTHGDSNFIGIHTDWTDHPHGDSGLPHVDSPSVGHADGWTVPHVDSPSTAHLDTAQVVHADSPSTAHVDTATVLHADSPAVLHADSPAMAHMDDPGHWGT